MYTYDDFQKAAKASGYYGEFSDADLKLAQQNPDAGMSLLSGKKEWHSATTDDQRALANAETEKVRRTNGGYTAGKTGSEFILSDSPSGYKQENWTDPYAAQKTDALTKAETSYTGYSPETDPTAQAYHKAYVREGQRATQDALGTAAQATGGIPSTYATTAASQAGQYYASKEADKTAELEENAYNRYMKEKNADLQILSALETLSSNNRSNYNTDRNFGYGKFTDELSWQKNAEDTAQSRSDTERDRNQSNLKDIANTMMKAGQFDRLKELGYTDAEVAALKKQYDDEKAAEAAGSSTGRSGGKSSGNSGSKKSYKTGGTGTKSGQTITSAQAEKQVNELVAKGYTLQDIASEINKNRASFSEEDYNQYYGVLMSRAKAAGANHREGRATK